MYIQRVSVTIYTLFITQTVMIMILFYRMQTWKQKYSRYSYNINAGTLQSQIYVGGFALPVD